MSSICGSLSAKKHGKNVMQPPCPLTEAFRRPNSAVIEQVKQKLEKFYHADLQHSNQTDGPEGLDLHTEAENLTNVEKIKQVHLKSLLESSQSAISKWKCESILRKTIERSLDFRKALHTVDERFKEIVSLPVTLYLTEMDSRMLKIIGRAVPSSLLKAEYGPLHAALQVGDVLLEWRKNDLVRPYTITPESELQQHPNRKIKFTGPIQHHGTFYKEARQQRETVRETIHRDRKKMDFSQQIQIASVLGEHRERLIHKLAKVISRYNSYNYYDLLHRNCQNFVRDCLKALEIEFSDKPQFSEAIQEQLEKIKKCGTVSSQLKSRLFHSHSELDTYYEIKKDELNDSEDDLHYMLLLYCKYHLESLKARKMDESWTCQEQGCKMSLVQAKLSELKRNELGVTTPTRSHPRTLSTCL